MAGMIKLEVEGYRDSLGRFAKRTEELARGRREMIRESSRSLVKALRYYAPQRTGKFAQGIHYRTDDRGATATGTIYVRGEHAFLLPFITEGTRPHPIAAVNTPALRFFWPRGPEGPGIYYYKSVQHPGTMPDPFVAQAIDAVSPQMDMELAKVGRRVAWLSG